jgi:hypothetical protein
VAGSPIGGVLYEHAGYHAPFIFCISLILFDCGGCLSVLEPPLGRGYASQDVDTQFSSVSPSQQILDTEPSLSATQTYDVELRHLDGEQSCNANKKDTDEVSQVPSVATFSTWRAFVLVCSHHRVLSAMFMTFSRW